MRVAPSQEVTEEWIGHENINNRGTTVFEPPECRVKTTNTGRRDGKVDEELPLAERRFDSQANVFQISIVMVCFYLNVPLKSLWEY